MFETFYQLLEHQAQLTPENIAHYAKHTVICMDNELRSNINGIALAEKLHQHGFTNLYLFTGRDFTKSEVPNYLKVLKKNDLDSLNQLL